MVGKGRKEKKKVSQRGMLCFGSNESLFAREHSLLVLVWRSTQKKSPEEISDYIGFTHPYRAVITQWYLAENAVPLQALLKDLVEKYLNHNKKSALSAKKQFKSSL
ncbi:hypothetical protein NPIL_670111 [Nephila pilipes]|uniref:Uncharacterized protein n=1 Tax=Nephila pilipes TaxID=299642 RepID=A0A8X6R3G4_NEPPI|nr:hypothetical protein NPIL_670111 [Nephila pilipes]